MLARLEDAAAIELLSRMELSPLPIRNFSAYVVYMAKRSELAPVYNSRSVSTRESACFNSGPQSPDSSSGRGESPIVPLRHKADAMEVEHASFQFVRPVQAMIRGDQLPSSSLTLSPFIQQTEVMRAPKLSSVERQRGDLGEMDSPHMLFLGELGFNKAFLILNYLRGRKLEDTIQLDFLKGLKFMHMVDFEAEIWNKFGESCIEPSDRRKNIDWDLVKNLVYHCHVDVEGNILFKGPYFQSSRTHLQNVLGDDNILLVKFAELDNGSSADVKFSAYCSAYHRIAETGIILGLRRYDFFVFKDGGKEERRKSPTSSSVRCYFVRTESRWTMDNAPYVLSNKSMHEARAIFMHVHTISNLAKYMARFSLILSKTIKLDIDFSTVNVQQIEDIPCKDDLGNIVFNEDGEPIIHSDGTGLISEDLAMKCPLNVFKGGILHPELQHIADNEEHLGQICNSEQHTVSKNKPLLMQFRMFYHGIAVKGTVHVDRRLPLRTICVRPSMVKVKADPKLSSFQSFNSLEIVSTSNRPKRSSLSKGLIALLHYGGVPVQTFMDLLTTALSEAVKTRYSKRDAIKAAINYGDMDDCIAARMILSGIPLNEPYLQYRLSIMMKEDRKTLKMGRIPIDDCYYLMGTVDPTGTLKPNEVCVILDSGQVSGQVLVYKNPGLHFGDIHVLMATYVQDLESIVGRAKYVIFFPITGPRSLADEMANSDFDGDIYWISRNVELLKYFKPSKPWVRSEPVKKKPNLQLPENLEPALFHHFLKTRFTPSFAMSAAADCWLAYMDRLLTHSVQPIEKKEVERKLIRLVDIYYDALDAPKNGMQVEVPAELRVFKFPHYMERPKDKSYNSKSILGMIYDTVENFQTQDSLPMEISLLPCFNVQVPPSCLNLWGRYYADYCKQMTNLLKMEQDLESKDSLFHELYQQYTQLLYHSPTFESSGRSRDDIFNEALAIYQIVYKKAMMSNLPGSCCFAWKVAGSALCKLYADKQGDSLIGCSRTVLREILR